MSSPSISRVAGETTISVSMPTESKQSDLATADQTKLLLCEIEPAYPSGQIGERSLATPTSCTTFQRFNSVVAHDRPAANSRCRLVASCGTSETARSSLRRRKTVCVPIGNTEFAHRETVFTRSSAQVGEVEIKGLEATQGDFEKLRPENVGSKMVVASNKIGRAKSRAAIPLGGGV